MNHDLPTPDRPLVFVGAGELGRDALSVVEALERAGRGVELLGFVDDGAEPGTRIHDHPVLGGTAWLLERLDEVAVHVAIGTPAVRERVVGRLAEAGAAFATLAHPTAVVGRTVTVGEGTLVMAGVTTTVDTRIGAQVVVNPGCTLAHDVTVGDFAYLSPGVDLAGRVRVGRRAYLGTGAVAIPGVDVGEGAVLGAGCVAIRDVAPGTTVVGVPGRVLHRASGEEVEG